MSIRFLSFQRINVNDAIVPVASIACTWYQYYRNVVFDWEFRHFKQDCFFSLLPLKSQPNSTKGRMFITRLQQTQLINAVLVHPLPRMNAIWKRFFYPPVIHRTFLPVCLFIDSHVPALLTSSPLCAAVLGRGGAGQGALHARAGEVPEDRSLQAFQEEGPGEAEGQAEQGRWGRQLM